MEDRFVFLVEWFDNLASLNRHYNLSFFPNDISIELFDIKNKRIFLKKTKNENIKLEDIYVGANISIFSRQFKVLDYGDTYTKSLFEKTKENTLALIKPDSYKNIGKIINIIEKENVLITKLKMFKFSKDGSNQFYSHHNKKPFFEELINFINSNPCIGLELLGDNIITKWNEIIGPTNSQLARVQKPDSIRALYGNEGVRNAVHGSENNFQSKKEIDLIFNNNDYNLIKSTAILNNCSIIIIKPHILLEKKLGLVLDYIISKGLIISAMEIFNFNKIIANEFFEIYKEILPDFNLLIEEVTSGPICVLEIYDKNNSNIVESVRNVCGNIDPKIAKNDQPSSIRAIFGKDKIKNAVHCTDLIEDGILDSEFFFVILQAKL